MVEETRLGKQFFEEEEQLVWSQPPVETPVYVEPEIIQETRPIPVEYFEPAFTAQILEPVRETVREPVEEVIQERPRQTFDSPPVVQEFVKEVTEVIQERPRPADFFEAPVYEVPITETQKEMVDPVTIGLVVGVGKALMGILNKPADFKIDSGGNGPYRLIHIASNTVVLEEARGIINKLYRPGEGASRTEEIRRGGLWLQDVQKVLEENGEYSTLLLLEKKNVDPMSFQSFIDSLSSGIKTAQQVSTAAQTTWGTLSGFFENQNSTTPPGAVPPPATASTINWQKVLLYGGIAVAALLLLPRLLGSFFPRRS
jgi:hypothetical protein